MSKSKTISLTIWVNRHTKKVVMAECHKDFVDILFSFLTLTLGNVNEILGKKSPRSCLKSLGEGIKNLDTEASENTLLPQRSPTELYGVYKTYMVTDDLNVITFDDINFFALMRKLGIEDLDDINDVELEVSNEEFLSLLERSFVSKTPLSDVFLRSKLFKCLKYLTRSLRTTMCSKFEGSNGVKKLMPTSETGTKAYSTSLQLSKDRNDLRLGSIVKVLGKSSPSVECLNNLQRTMEALGSDAEMTIDAQNCAHYKRREEGCQS